MKKALFILFISFSFLCFSENFPSKIDAVTVYLNQAKIKRSAPLTLKKGENLIEIIGLSEQLDINSIQARLEGMGVILSVDFSLDYLNIQKKEERITLLYDSLASLVSQREILMSDIDVFKSEKAILLKNDDLKNKQSSFKVEELKSLIDFQRKRGLELSKIILDLNIGIQNLTKKIDAYSNERYELEGAKPKPKGKINLKISSSNGGRSILFLEYLVKQANWTPIYDVRVDEINKPINIIFKANVVQSSGEDWDNVLLTLSTGNPTNYQSIPDLKPIVSSLREEYHYKKRRSFGRAPIFALEDKLHHGGISHNNNSSPRKDNDNEYKKEEYLKYEVTEKENQLSNEYQINLEQSVASNGQAHLVNIKPFEMDAKCSYYSIPKLNTSAFLLAEVYNWYQYDLLSGRANIFFEGAYVGKTNIKTNTTDDTLAFSLGIDEDIQISRTPIKEKSGSKLLSFKKEITYTYKIEVLNTKKAIIVIEVIDQIPITTDEEIEITFDNKENGNFDTESGEVSWIKTLKPGEKSSWYFTYSLKYPKSKLIKGTK